MTERELLLDEPHRRLAARYGSSAGRRAPRWVYRVLLGVAVLVGVAVTVVAYRNLGPQPIEGTQTSMAFGDHSVTLTFAVTRDHPERPADCLVRARSKDGDEVGRKEVYVPAASGTIQLITILRTSKQPVTGEVYGCSYRVPPYLSPQPQPIG